MSNESVYYRKFKTNSVLAAMDRRVVSKSHYKFVCAGCNRFINKGDLITHCQDKNGMELRARTDGQNFYTPIYGSRWVHRDCNIVEWDDFYKNDIMIWTNWEAMKLVKDIETSIELLEEQESYF